MPNNTTNQLRVSGPAESIQKMKDMVKGDEQDFSCHAFLPMPSEIRNTTKGFGIAQNETPEETHEREQREARLLDKYGSYNWYDWAIEHWGTKWDVYSFDDEMVWEEEGDNEVYIQFFSAWSPPIPVIVALGKKFPELKFVLDYSDEGEFYAGRLVCENGDATDQCFENRKEIEEHNRKMGLIVEK